MSQQREKTYLDILRLVAILLVVFNHTNGFYCSPYSGVSDWEYWWLLLQNQVVKMAVPLFFMVTGALLLAREESIGDIWRKRILRFIVVFFIIAVVQYAFFCYWNDESFSPFHIYKLMYCNLGEHNSFYADWFLYAYVGMLIMLPFLRIVAKNISVRLFAYLFGVQVLFCCVLPVLSLCLGKYMAYSEFNDWIPFHQETKALPFAAGYCAFYVLTGYVLEHKISMNTWNKYRFKAILSAVGCLVAGCISMEVTRRLQGEAAPDAAWVFLTSFIPLPCAVVYMELKSACMRVQFKPALKGTIAAFGGAVFTVMLIENLFRVGWESYIGELEESIGRLPAAWLTAVLICLASLVVGVLLRKIPYVNRIF
ncbi:MAG: acyltransferase family protein [Akkermansia sp.]|nr:acyltransferase family protein [Akkermansia sp.]